MHFSPQRIARRLQITRHLYFGHQISKRISKFKWKKHNCQNCVLTLFYWQLDKLKLRLFEIWGSLPTYNIYGDIFWQIWRVFFASFLVTGAKWKLWREYFASFLVIGAKWINDWSAPLSLLIHAAPPTNAPFVAFILFPLCIIAIIRSAF